MTRHHETPQPWNRKATPWEPEPSPVGRAIIRQWIDQQLALVKDRRHEHRWKLRGHPGPDHHRKDS